MRQARKVIITCAPTGAIHPPSMSPHLPVTADEIADAAIAAAEAGAVILHLHARDPVDGRPTQDVDRPWKIGRVQCSAGPAPPHRAGIPESGNGHPR